MNLIFESLPIRKVYFGDRSTENLVSLLHEEFHNPIIVTSNSVSKNSFFQNLTSIVGAAANNNVVVYNGITQHSPLEEIEALRGTVEAGGFDLVVSVGGGSVIDSSKIARFTGERRIPMVAIPTTLSASEFSHIAGYSEHKEKKGKRGKEYTPDFVILDPRACIETPDMLWKSTGIRALDHAIESALDIPDWSPFLWPSVKSIELLTKYLGRKDIESIEYCQEAAWLSYLNVYASPMGLSHNIGKVIGARWNIPHGITSCITLPRVLKYYALWSPKRIYNLASKFYPNQQMKQSVLDFSEMVTHFINSLGLSSNFEEYGIGIADLKFVISQVGGDELLVDTLLS